MGTVLTSCGECLSVQDWYREPEPIGSRRIHGYEIRRRVRQHHIKRSYAGRFLIERRQQFYELARAAAATVVVDTDLSARFYEQADKWERETRHVSSMTDIVMHSSYQAIIKMGPDVIPFLLRDMKENRRLWFTALAQLAGENPIKPSDAGRVDRMTTSWLKWGKEKGFL
jgi:hypothetical protein